MKKQEQHYYRGYDETLTGQTVSCEIPSAQLMSETTLTCYFPEDVSQTKKDITVYHHNSDPGIVPDHVLECIWVRGERKCLVHPEYEFNNNVTNHLIVRIAQVSENYEGNYSCRTSGTRVENIKFCEFHLLKNQPLTVQANLATKIAPPVAIVIFLLIICVGTCRLRRIGHVQSRLYIVTERAADNPRRPTMSEDRMMSNGSAARLSIIKHI